MPAAKSTRYPVRVGELADAIREHLELKRRRGADPSEVEREEHEALAPVTRSHPVVVAPPPIEDDAHDELELIPETHAPAQNGAGPNGRDSTEEEGDGELGDATQEYHVIDDGLLAGRDWLDETA